MDLNWEQYVAHDERYERPSEVDALIGDAAKAEHDLGWRAETFGEDLVDVMVDADVQRSRTNGLVGGSGSTAKLVVTRAAGSRCAPLRWRRLQPAHWNDSWRNRQMPTQPMYVAGHRGLVRSAVWGEAKSRRGVRRRPEEFGKKGNTGDRQV